ncbi:hypothetical protein Bca52824_052977 [Brassica carinata]|uniref:Uncharacterized protein n=1 Tax=Brassica carinata TaxID=52824 RepID=A0A8X7R5I3_BRACI|nr:hypothetical protein Bca52824_052977 [Brassica carinata]
MVNSQTHSRIGMAEHEQEAIRQRKMQELMAQHGTGKHAIIRIRSIEARKSKLFSDWNICLGKLMNIDK